MIEGILFRKSKIQMIFISTKSQRSRKTIQYNQISRASNKNIENFNEIQLDRRKSCNIQILSTIQTQLISLIHQDKVRNEQIEVLCQFLFQKNHLHSFHQIFKSQNIAFLNFKIKENEVSVQLKLQRPKDSKSPLYSQYFQRNSRWINILKQKITKKQFFDIKIDSSVKQFFKYSIIYINDENKYEYIFAQNLIIDQSSLFYKLKQNTVRMKKLDDLGLQEINESQDNLSYVQKRQTQQQKQKKQTQQYLVHEATKNINQIDPNILIKQLQIKKQLSQFQIGQLMYLMFYILNYPSLTEADTHAFASRLGCYDIKKENPVGKGKEYCKCCGYLKQDQPIPLCTAFDNFPSVGISTYLFFQTIKNLILLLIFLFLFQGLYALITNLHAARVFTLKPDLYINNLISYISLDSKVTASNSTQEFNVFYMIQMWIGVGLVILWSLLLYLIRYYERKYEVMVDKETVSAADFSIIIQNYPREITQAELQIQLNQYAQKLQSEKSDIFKIQTMSLSADITLEKQDEEQMKKINDKYLEMLDMFADWVCQLQETGTLPMNYQKRSAVYQKFQRIKNKRVIQNKKMLRTLYRPQNQNYRQEETELFQNNHSTMKTQPNQEKQQNKAIAIVTFKYSNSKDLISKHNSMDFAKMIRHFLRCCPVKNKLILTDHDNKERKIQISKAPEPQDIKWQNLSVSRLQKIFRKAATYLSTLILLAISFTLVYLLSLYSSNNKSNQFLNFAISLIISLINFVIGFLIRFLTFFEKDYTETGYQTSLAIKSIWAQLLNSIVVPIIVNYIIEEKNIFGQNGLSTDIVYLSITNSFLPPLTKLIDPYHKYILLKGYYYRRSLKQRLLMRQIQLNQSQQLVQFEAGYQYIYFINLYLFISFFVTLQPCISIFGICGMFLMYWLQKYTLLYRMKRPVPGTDLVNTAMSQMINLGPLFFTIGALCWSHLLDGYKVQQGVVLYYVPNIIAASLAALFFIFPFNVIFDKYLPNQELENLDYEQCRILLNSEYDRTNPATLQKAIKEYQQYLQKLMQEEQKTKSRESKTTNKTKTKKKIAFDLGQQDQLEQIQLKKKSSTEKNLNNVSRMKNMAVDKLFISRKKEVLRNRTKIKSKLIDGPQEQHIQEEEEDQQKIQQVIKESKVENSNMFLTVKKESNQKQAIYGRISNNQISKKTTESQYIQEPKPQKISNEIQPKKFVSVKHIEKEKNVNFKDESGDPSSILPKDTVKQDQLIIKKQKPEKPKKVNLDFRAFLPIQNTEAFFQNSPDNQRDDSYMNFFAKKLSGTALTDYSNRNQQIKQKRSNNPYQKAFN